MSFVMFFVMFFNAIESRPWSTAMPVAHLGQIASYFTAYQDRTNRVRFLYTNKPLSSATSFLSLYLRSHHHMEDGRAN